MKNIMKTQLILALAFSTLSLIGCEDEQVRPTNPKPTPQPTITSFHPESGAGGAVVAIFGKNFGPSMADNYVTFNGSYSEVMQVQPGTIMVRVPLALAQGDYTINVSTRGHTVTSTKTLKVNVY